MVTIPLYIDPIKIHLGQRECNSCLSGALSIQLQSTVFFVDIRFQEQPTWPGFRCFSTYSYNLKSE
jgi:hypothetical protein